MNTWKNIFLLFKAQEKPSKRKYPVLPDMGKVFNSVSEFKTQKAPNAFEDFLALQKNPEALTQNSDAKFTRIC